MATKVAGERYYELDGQLLEIKRQLRQLNGYPFDPEILKIHLRAAIEGRFNMSVEKIAYNFLKLISGGESLLLDPTDGTKTLANAKDVFVWINSDFNNWGADEQGQPTVETTVDVYEMAKDATFLQMFSELNADVSKLCLTQHQIKNFVKKYRQWLRTEGYGTFFLFESSGVFFVADVRFDSDGELDVSVNHFEYSHVWYDEYRHRLVVPKLA